MNSIKHLAISPPKAKKLPASQCFGQARLIPNQPAEAGHPGEAGFDYPSASTGSGLSLSPIHNICARY